MIKSIYIYIYKFIQKSLSLSLPHIHEVTNIYYFFFLQILSHNVGKFLTLAYFSIISSKKMKLL